MTNEVSYAPSETLAYRTCPRLWAFKRQRWMSSSFGHGQVSMAIGTGIHKAGEIIHEARVRDTAFDPEEGIATATKAARKDIDALIDAGVMPVRQVENWEERVEKTVRSGSTAYWKAFKEKVLQDNQVFLYEENFGYERGEAGYEGTLDLALLDPSGRPIIADIKTKSPFKSDYYRQMYVDEFAFSWQMYQYAWLVDKKLAGHHPPVDTFWLIMVELKPNPVVTVYPYRRDPYYAQYWYTTVRRLWDEMKLVEDGFMVPGIAPEHYFYGRPCEFRHACFGLRADAGLMRGSYVQLEV